MFGFGFELGLIGSGFMLGLGLALRSGGQRAPVRIGVPMFASMRSAKLTRRRRISARARARAKVKVRVRLGLGLGLGLS